MPDLAVIAELIAPEAEALGFDLVRVAWFPQGAQVGDEPTLQIMAERPDTRQLNIDDCANLSRRISDRFDELEEAGSDPIPEAYRLEVSSPGIDRPLTRLQDYADWIGHEAKITLIEGVDGRKALRGDLAGVEGETVLLQDRKSGRIAFAFDDVADAKLMFTDRLLRATRPLDVSGVDEEVVETETDTEEQED